MFPTICVLSLLLADASPPASASYPRAQLLVEPTQLLDRHTADMYRILDARKQSACQAGHIPGAVWVNHDAWSEKFNSDPSRQSWSQRIGELGIDVHTPVVVYADSINDAARIWWILRYWGIGDVRLLNGGWHGWRDANGPVVQDAPHIEGKHPALQPHEAILATKEQLLEWIPRKATQIVDARSEGEYCGTEQLSRRSGAMPGAIHLEWTDVLDPQTKRFKSAAELSRLFQQAGIDLQRPTITHCQGGGRAAVLSFALDLMGARDVRTYYKSWAEWGNAEDTPIVKPAARR